MSTTTKWVLAIAAIAIVAFIAFVGLQHAGGLVEG